MRYFFIVCMLLVTSCASRKPVVTPITRVPAVDRSAEIMPPARSLTTASSQAIVVPPPPVRVVYLHWKCDSNYLYTQKNIVWNRTNVINDIWKIYTVVFPTNVNVSLAITNRKREEYFTVTSELR